VKRDTHRVTFQPDGRNVFVLRGTKAVEAAGQGGIALNQPCGGQGTCGKCKVRVLENPPEPTDAEKRLLGADELREGARLACQLSIDRDMVIWVPEETRFFEQQILTEGTGPAYRPEPNVRKRFVTLPPPTVEDLRSCLDRLTDSLSDEGEEFRVDLSLLRALPSAIKEEGFKVTVVLQGNRIEWIERGDTTDRIWGVAFDIGTTTIVGALIDLRTGKQDAVASRTNPQIHFGDDVVSRIRYAEQHPKGLEQMRKRLIGCLNDIIVELVNTAGIEHPSVYEAVAVGNTTMSHIFLGLDPTSIGHAPYVAVLRSGLDVKASNVGLEINQNANLHTLPNIAGFVGSDTVGMIIATGMMHTEEVRLAIDIGTNGELVVGNRDRLVACSCAAGPAFEGARIKHGMRATDGAISKVVINEGIEVNVIGGGRPSGICGSGLVDAIAELLNAGIIDETGRIVEPQRQPEHVEASLADAVTEMDGQPAVVLVGADRSKTGQPLALTQRDVREVQLAKAAVRAGVEVLCRHYGVDMEDVVRILLAGGFGNFIRRSNAQRIGLLPPVPTRRIEFVGNAALAGAKVALVSRSFRREGELISKKTEYVELANRRDFQSLFAEFMMFPRDS